MEFTDVNGYYLPAEVDKYIDEQQAEIDSYKRTVKEEYAKREALEAEIDEALDRLWDMSLADDGHAWKEAERFYSKYRDDWGKHKGE